MNFPSSTKASQTQEDSIDDCIVSVSSDEGEFFAVSSVPEEVPSEEDILKDVASLFQSSTKKFSNQKTCSMHYKLSPSQIPPQFSSLIEKYGLIFG